MAFMICGPSKCRCLLADHLDHDLIALGGDLRWYQHAMPSTPPGFLPITHSTSARLVMAVARILRWALAAMLQRSRARHSMEVLICAISLFFGT
jgi:hypothetical protein